MKTIFALIVLACTTAFVSQAQTQIKSGIKGGFGVANARGEDNIDGKVGYKLGIGSDISSSNFFSLRPSLYFSNKGYEISTLENTLITNANYLELPICFAIKLPLTKRIKVSANIGPYFAYGIGGKTKLEGSGINDSWKTFKGTTIDGTEYGAAERFDWGGTAGASVELFFLYVGINYDLGLKNIYSVPKADRREYMKNGMWWASLGILF